MTTEVELLPLPSPQVPFIDCDPSMTDIRRLVRWYEQGATEYARANIAHAVAPLQAEIERLNRILGRIVEGDGDTTVTIRTGADAFAAAREYLLRDQESAVPSAGQTTGITATELGYALKRATPAQVIEYLEDDVDMHVALSIYFEDLHHTAALQAEVEALRKLLDRMVVCNPDGSVGIRVTEDALNAAAELYRLFDGAKKEAGND